MPEGRQGDRDRPALKKLLAPCQFTWQEPKFAWLEDQGDPHPFSLFPRPSRRRLGRGKRQVIVLFLAF
jgi:hypothetical protein